MLSFQLKIQSRKINGIQIFGNSLAAEFCCFSFLFFLVLSLFANHLEMSSKSIYQNWSYVFSSRDEENVFDGKKRETIIQNRIDLVVKMFEEIYFESNANGTALRIESWMRRRPKKIKLWETNLILFNNISADFTQINWIQPERRNGWNCEDSVNCEERTE